jgi:hypothetical protein
LYAPPDTYNGFFLSTAFPETTYATYSTYTTGERVKNRAIVHGVYMNQGAKRS